MAMASIGGALSAATSFLGLGAGRSPPEPAFADADHASDGDGDPLAPGNPCFEVVAQALAEAGYLDD